AAPPRKRRRREEEDDEEAAEAAAVGPQSVWGARLPPEILARIFQAVVEEEGAVPFLCRVARVCRLWRRVAAAPRLWRRVSLGGCWGAPGPGRSPHAQGRVLGTVSWLVESRFSLLQEFELWGWKSHVGFVLQALASRCPLLASLSLCRCGGVPAQPLARLPPRCPRLRCLQLRHCQAEPSAVLGFLEAAGPRLQRLRLSCGPRLGPVLAALASGRCPDLRLLELDGALGGSSPPLALPVEGLQAACPNLQVLRLLNLSWVPRQCRPAAPPAPPGFPRLEELSLAGAGGCGAGPGDAALGRLLRTSGRLRLLDLRGCARVTPRALLGLPCADLEQLYLGLPCGAEELPRHTEGSAGLAWKWRRSLRELDLAGRSFGQRDLARAMAAFGPASPLRSLNLAGTKVTPDALSALLPACPDLAYLNLSSCRHLPRGTKRPHRGCREVRHCLQLIAGQTPGAEGAPSEPLNEEPPNGTPNENTGEGTPSEEPPGEERSREGPPNKPLNEEPPNETPGEESPNVGPPLNEPLNEEPPNKTPNEAPSKGPPATSHATRTPPTMSPPNESLNEDPPQ
ncbi:F-box/LRR-repeat protein 6, partial [Morus bassanus]